MRRLAFRRAPAQYNAEFMETMAAEYLSGTRWSRLRLAAVEQLVEPAPGERVLDLGCAAGAVSHFLAGFGCRTVGVDAEPLAVEKARSLFPELDFRLADVAALPFATSSFDKAVAADLVEHLDDDTHTAMLREVARVLVPGGTLSVYTPNPSHLIERLKARDLVLAQNPTHIGLRDTATLKAALERQRYAVEVDAWRPSFFPVLRWIERALGRWTALLRYRLCLRARTSAKAEGKEGIRRP